jgi:hypothetical protein
MTTIIKKQIIAFYLEYVNDFLTTDRMSEYYEIPKEDCEYLIRLGKKYHEGYVSMLTPIQ